MREHKYRAWHKKEHKMYPVKSLTWFDEKVVPEGMLDTIRLDRQESKITTAVMFLSPEDVELMEWTGLKDKNKKDIYEGDILEDIWGTRLEVFSFIDETHALSGFAFRPIKKDEPVTVPHVTYQSWLKVAEIIGNVHEHPHLLENKSEATHD